MAVVYCVNKMQSLSFLALLSKWSNSGQGCCLEANIPHSTELPNAGPACAPQRTQQIPSLWRACSTQNASLLSGGLKEALTASPLACGGFWKPLEVIEFH